MIHRLMLCVIALFALTSLLIVSTSAQPRPTAESKIYLPLALAAPRAVLPPGDSGPAGAGALFPTRALRTNSAAIAIDPAGALHLAYAEYGDSNQDGKTR